MPSNRKGLRLLLEPGMEHQIHQLALKEGRPLTAMCNRLLGEALAARQAAAHQVDEVRRITEILKTPTNVEPTS
jgi:hypothetical protein